jgi:DNA-binding transcriptional MerR regulator
MLHLMQLMPIGRFSRLTGVGVKSLRHYDEVGLLVPAAVDAETGYRFYSPDQVDQAEAIRLLRKLEMPLEEIRSTLAADDPAALRDALVSHQRQMASRESELRASMARLQRLIDGRETIVGMRSESLQAEDHRRLGIDLYNRTWTLMDSPGDEMLYCAHASAYHWMQSGGTTANRARSEWLCSRVYSILGRPEPALHHARRCIELVESSPAEMDDWDLAAAHEALARAHLTAGEMEEARRTYELAREETARIANPEDRKHIEADLDALPL